MRTVNAVDLRPGLRQQTTRTISAVTFRGNTVHVEWSDGMKQVLQRDSAIEVADG